MSRHPPVHPIALRPLGRPRPRLQPGLALEAALPEGALLSGPSGGIALAPTARVLLDARGRAVARVWMTQDPDTNASIEHWIYSDPGADLTHERHLLLGGALTGSWAITTEGRVLPTLLTEVSDARYALVEPALEPTAPDPEPAARRNMGAILASDLVRKDLTRVSLLTRAELRRPGLRRPAVRAFDILTLPRPGWPSQRIGRLIREYDGASRWVETRIGQAHPLQSSEPLVLEPVQAYDANAFVEASLELFDPPVVTRATVERQVPEPAEISFSLMLGIKRQFDPGSANIITASGLIGKVRTQATFTLGQDSDAAARAGSESIGGASFTEIWEVDDENLLLAPEPCLLTLLSGTAGPSLMARMATLTFSYFEPPEPDGNGGFAVVNLPPLTGPVTWRHSYEVHRNEHDGGTTRVGALYREIEWANGQATWRDHWMMQEGYRAPSLLSTVTLSSAGQQHASRHAFLSAMHGERAGAQDWSYVEVAYSWSDAAANPPLS